MKEFTHSQGEAVKRRGADHEFLALIIAETHEASEVKTAKALAEFIRDHPRRCRSHLLIHETGTHKYVRVEFQVLDDRLGLGVLREDGVTGPR